MSVNINDILQKMARERDEEMDEAKDSLKVLFRKARVAGYKTAAYEYNGSSDSGGIESIQSVAPDTLPDDAPVLLKIEEPLTAFLPSGFELNEGSQGTIHVDFVSGEIVVDHEWNVERSKDEVFEYDLAPGRRLPEGLKKRAIAPALTGLRSRGYRRIQIPYQGGWGDKDAGGPHVVDPVTLPNTGEALTALADALAPLLPDGWAEERGSRGAMDLDLETGHLVIRHSWLEIGTEPETATFAVDVNGEAGEARSGGADSEEATR